jgi:hypothetical protein
MPIVQKGELYDRARDTYLCETASTKNRVVIAGTAGVVASGTRREGVIRTPLSGTTSLCIAGYSRGSAGAAGNLVLMEVAPDSRGGTGTEIPTGVGMSTGAIGDAILVATRGAVVLVEVSAAVKNGQTLGASGTDGRVAPI